MLVIIASVLLVVALVELVMLLAFNSEIEDLKVRLENADTSIEYWHDRWEKERK